MVLYLSAVGDLISANSREGSEHSCVCGGSHDDCVVTHGAAEILFDELIYQKTVRRVIGCSCGMVLRYYL